MSSKIISIFELFDYALLFSAEIASNVLDFQIIVNAKPTLLTEPLFHNFLINITHVT
jgi:hypothetical protein